ncbi:MAG: GNAT family N-acetyltransferase [Terriglobales bacterium]
MSLAAVETLPVLEPVVASTRGWITSIEEWERLELEAHPGAREFWMSWLWLSTWWQVYGTGRQLRIAVVEGQKWVSCPLYRQRRLGVRQLAFLGSASRRHALGDAVPDAAERMARWLAERRDWDSLKLEAVPAGERAAWKRGFDAADLKVCEGQCWLQRSIPLHRPWQEVTAGFRPGLLSNLARRERMLARAGSVRLRQVATSADLADVFETCLAMEASGWKGDAGSAMAQNPLARRFYSLLAQRAAERNQLRLTLLELNGAPIAFSLRLRHGNTLASLKIGYDRAHRRFAPGAVLQYQVLREAQAEGIEEVDLSGGDDAYKADWTACGQQLGDLQVYNRTALGRAARMRACWRHALGADGSTPAITPPVASTARSRC